MKSFAESGLEGCFLLVASRNSAKYLKSSPSSERILVLDRFLSADEMRDVYCASDFVVNDAPEYLTSGVVRSAMSYGVPVIARDYGSTPDMARGAMVEIGPQGLTEAMRRAASLTEGERAALASAALARDGERSWAAAGKILREVYETVARGKGR